MNKNKTKLLTTLFLFTNLLIFSQDNITDILTFETWLIDHRSNICDSSEGYFTITFLNNNNLIIKFTPRMETEESINGSYKVDKNVIYVQIEKPFKIFSNTNQVFTLHSYESLKSKYFIKSNENVIFNNEFFPLKANDIVNLNFNNITYKIKMIEPENYTLIENLNMREYPNINSKKVYKINTDNSWSRKTIIKEKRALTKDTVIKIIGVTLEKYKINELALYVNIEVT